MSRTKEIKPEIEYLSASHRLQSDIEDHLVARGKNSLEKKTFDDQLRLRSASNQAETNKVKWEIWEQFVWTPGYVAVYGDIRRLIKSWEATPTTPAQDKYTEKTVQTIGYISNISQQRGMF